MVVKGMKSMLDAYRLYSIARKQYLKRNFRIAKIITKINNLVHNSNIPHTAQIGENSSFGYGGIGVVLHKNCKIGKKCVIGQGCTIGGRAGHGGPPVIGDNVYIGPGARLLGDFKIGNNVVIGANAVVIKDVPDNSVVGGVPARVLGTDPSRYLKME